jgi:hypothetical protein
MLSEILFKQGIQEMTSEGNKHKIQEVLSKGVALKRSEFTRPLLDFVYHANDKDLSVVKL